MKRLLAYKGKVDVVDVKMIKIYIYIYVYKRALLYYLLLCSPRNRLKQR